MHIICSDALQFISENKAVYDLVTVDLFIDTQIPVPFHSSGFLLDLRRSIAPGGTLLFSRLAGNWRRDAHLIRELGNIFPGAEEIDTNGNLILCWKAPEHEIRN
jgi:spermidine synthase